MVCTCSPHCALARHSSRRAPGDWLRLPAAACRRCRPTSSHDSLPSILLPIWFCPAAPARPHQRHLPGGVLSPAAGLMRGYRGWHLDGPARPGWHVAAQPRVPPRASRWPLLPAPCATGAGLTGRLDACQASRLGARFHQARYGPLLPPLGPPPHCSMLRRCRSSWQTWRQQPAAACCAPCWTAMPPAWTGWPPSCTGPTCQPSAAQPRRQRMQPCRCRSSRMASIKMPGACLQRQRQRSRQYQRYSSRLQVCRQCRNGRQQCHRLCLSPAHPCCRSQVHQSRCQQCSPRVGPRTLRRAAGYKHSSSCM